jgi:tyrosine-protein kinase Etk/Wzc
MSELIQYAERRPAPAGAPELAYDGASRGVDPYAAETIDLREVLAVLRRRAALIAGVAVLTLAAAGFVVLRQVPQYRATAVIRLLDERQALAGGIGSGAVEEMVLGKTSDPLLSQLQVLRSRTVAGAVVDQLGLRLRPLDDALRSVAMYGITVPETLLAETLRVDFDDREYSVRSGAGGPVRAAYGAPVEVNGVRFTIAGRPAASAAALEVLPRGAAVEWVVQNVRATPREKTDVIDVEFTATDPVVAQRIVNELVTEFQAANAREAQRQARRRRAFVEEQLAQTDSALAAARLALTEFQRREEVYSSQQKFAAQQAGSMELEMRREELDADRRMLQLLLARMGNDASSRGLRTLVSTPGMAQNAVVAQLYGQWVEYEAARDSLTTGSWSRAETHPDVQRLNTLVQAARNKLIDAVQSHIASLEARVAALDELKARQAAELQALPTSGAEEVELAQRVQTISKMADQLREEYQRARIAEAVEAGQVEIVDAASVPDQPIGSGKGLKLALGLMLGLMLGSGGAFVLEHLNTSIRRRDELESVLRVPGLAIVPRLSGAAASESKRLRLPGRAPRGGSGAGAAATELVTLADARSSSAEAYRTLRTNLLFSQAVQKLQTLVVTSAAPSEGKTTVAANLAVTFAQQGMRVALVDCDLRKARLHTVFDVPREPGLTQLLIAAPGAAEAVRATAVEGLAVVPAGTLPPNPAELLGGKAMRQLVERLQERFDLVIFDTPPLLAAADAAVLGELADGTVLVVRAGRTDRGAAQQALQQLRMVGARVLGAVLNDPDAEVEAYGGGYYYDYYGATRA